MSLKQTLGDHGR